MRHSNTWQNVYLPKWSSLDAKRKISLSLPQSFHNFLGILQGNFLHSKIIDLPKKFKVALSLYRCGSSEDAFYISFKK